MLLLQITELRSAESPDTSEMQANNSPWIQKGTSTEMAERDLVSVRVRLFLHRRPFFSFRHRILMKSISPFISLGYLLPPVLPLFLHCT